MVAALLLLMAAGVLGAGNRPAGAAQATATPAAAFTPAPLPNATPPTGKALVVVTSTPLLADLVRQVGGDRVKVRAILPADADPHEYEPTPRDMAAIEDARLVVVHGLQLDAWAQDLVKESETDALVIVATEGVPTLKVPGGEFKQGDPHVWFDPTNVEIMSRNIAAALTKIDPAGTASYAARRDAYIANLQALDRWIKADIATIPPLQRKLVTNHDAFGYYVHRYGLTFVGAVIPSLDTNTEPSAKQTAELIDKIKAQHVPAIFTEASINPKLERQIGKDAGVKVVPNLYGDNLGKPGSGADTYIGMMVTDTTIIVDNLR